MRLLRRFLNGHRSERYWRKETLEMAHAALGDISESPEKTAAILERAEVYLKFIQTGKADASANSPV